jgi:hypothetical protein
MKTFIQDQLLDVSGGIYLTGYMYELLEDAICNKLHKPLTQASGGAGHAGGGSSGGGGAGGW